MSYQVLARKWRPQRFSQVVGQQHVLSALENGLREDRLHHAYLFSGTRGVGKTSIARLFAKGLNCETGITADPCGQCANCKAIEEGRFIDLIEIDAASRTKVEDTRDVLDNVQYKPTVGRFKVYLIDEVHMLSRHSFNALLKTLEEPPEYVKFLLATTDPQKLPITILSRCMQFHLRALDPSQIRNHLEFILQEEQIPYELPALEKLAKAAQGSIRDSLSLTDQAIAVSNVNITLPIVSQMLGLIDDHQPIELVQALALADGEKAMNVIQTVAEKGIDWQQLLSDVAETLHQIAMLQLLPHPANEETPLHFLARQLSPEDVQFFYQLMLTGKKELPFAPEQRSGVEMTILRALAFHPKNVEQLAFSTAQTNQPNTTSQNNAQQNIAQLRQRLSQNQQVTTEPKADKAQNAPVTPTSDAQAVRSETTFATTTSSSSQSSQAEMATSTQSALMALNALKQLDASSDEQKKKSEPLISPTLHTQTVAKPSINKANLQERFSEIAMAMSEKKQIETNKNANVGGGTENVTSDEDYRWTWLNPELEHQEEQAKPSDIKQAILQERTPELVRKMIELSCQQDEWCELVNRLNLTGLTRQIALNSYVAHKEHNQLELVLKPSMAHLNTDDTRQRLTQAFEQLGLTYELSIGESEQHQTPLELRRTIFEKMTYDAKQALLADSKLQLLRNAFGATIDESTIRAVAE
ncbi:DNA polymerase III subunit gamma/tau [Ursidibacter maritimus]|uniref:DNA polymerase III subunit gamma/tau n=1 Tax=Ursidibacter maritimus TaxID=1331689 RepID=A0A949T493_9PAST|nr:DNA polymerase III subunit gamma/tau [Ursidibacter maritimus]KAE9540277.1 DNA polymerase III subunit gamma/tau [Ursidibacter maritimus]MBV6524174.1 DNA polymerase III subunit gamma/tau [Ursidibacter maritimus]MBV6525658.1 DNA polymerase III subunit gamma/tau [Ursidibacter maritimus]MBV6528147.1 DNA polymerase III subunit gamma/tau [Ursidibacter maritimus]MBV6528967.1 DNA polymerase III subunit gamma/tau [Ursidibacter maritimus]